jgi:hypothetical protein
VSCGGAAQVAEGADYHGSMASDSVSAHVHHVRNVRDEARADDSVTAHVTPLIQAGPIEVHASFRAELTVRSNEAALVPDLSVGLQKDQWLLGTSGVGLTAGVAVGHVPGGVIGAMAGYVVGRLRWRWRETHP